VTLSDEEPIKGFVVVCTSRGGRGAGDREKRRREVYGGGRRGGGKREKKGKIMQHCTIFCNRKNAKRRETKNTGREPGLKGMGSGRFIPPCPRPHHLACHKWSIEDYKNI